jgi:hypothetical protein
MTALVPCPACKRHVATREITCPFCASALPAQRARHAVVLGRVTRAAVFSAAVIACDSDKPAPAPAPTPAQGSDDLERLLDDPAAPRVAPPVDAALADAHVDAPLVDAGVPDAARPDAGVAKKKKTQKKRDPDNLEDVKIQEERFDQRHLAKPYGAPPARRRIV